MAQFMAIATPVLVSAGAIALPLAANAVTRRLRLRKALPIMRRVFTVLDPLLNEHLPSYRGSDVQFAAEVITAVLADGELNSDEVRWLSGEILKRWSPVAAAGRALHKVETTSQASRIYCAVESVVGKGYSLGAAVYAVKQAIR